MFINMNRKMKVTMMLTRKTKIKNKNYDGNSGDEENKHRKHILQCSISQEKSSVFTVCNAAFHLKSVVFIVYRKKTPN